MFTGAFLHYQVQKGLDRSPRGTRDLMIPSRNLVQLFSALPHEQNEFSSNEGIKYLQAFHHGQPDVGSDLNKLFHTAAVAH